MPFPVLCEFIALAAAWGSSFLFMRLCSAEFGPVALAFVRSAGAAVLLLPLAVAQHRPGGARPPWHAIAFVGLTNSALPFVCFSAASLAITTGLAAVFNATTPIWGALIAWLWLGERLNRSRITGIAIAFAGVVWLVGGRAGTTTGAAWPSPTLAIVLCLAATAMYAYSAAFTRRYLSGVAPLTLAAGSQISASFALAAPAAVFRPVAMPSASAWAAVLALAFLCTGVAYVSYFRLIARLGPMRTTHVTFLIPAFAVLWGTLLLHEPFGPGLAGGCLVILVGTSLATGLWQPRGLAAAER